MSSPVSIENPVLCRLLRPAVLLHLAAPKITQNGGQTLARSSGETPVPRLKQKVIQVTHTVETKIRSRPRRRKNIKPDTPKSGRKRTHSSRLVLPMFLERSTSSTAVVAIQVSRVRKEASMMLPNTQVKN